MMSATKFGWQPDQAQGVPSLIFTSSLVAAIKYARDMIIAGTATRTAICGHPTKQATCFSLGQRIPAIFFLLAELPA